MSKTNQSNMLEQTVRVVVHKRLRSKKWERRSCAVCERWIGGKGKGADYEVIYAGQTFEISVHDTKKCVQKDPNGSRTIWVKKFYLRTTTEGLPSIWWLKVNTESVIRRWLADPEGSHQINLIKHWGVTPDKQTIEYLKRVVENHVQELTPEILVALGDQPLQPYFRVETHKRNQGWTVHLIIGPERDVEDQRSFLPDQD